ncbi:MAG: hypothetical protein Q4D98_01865 [Planctomycetia bacterium]|nr:hypothetical protein [Planctomycetia bacterium]
MKNHSFVATGTRLAFLGFLLWGKWLAASEVEWNPEVREVGVFLCHATFSWDMAKEQLQILANLQRDIQQKLGLGDPREKVEVFLFSSQETWARYHRQYLPDTPFRRAMFRKPDVILKTKSSRGKIYAYLSPQLEQDLRHEGTHAILHATLGKPLPIWIDEGLAEYFEVSLPPWQNPTWLEQTRSRLQKHQTIPLKKLEKITGMRDMTREAYGDSWAWVVFLLDGPQPIRHILPDYLRDVSKKLFYPSLSSRITKVSKTPHETLLQRYFLREMPD